MTLSKPQTDLLDRLKTNADSGLTTDEASARREADGSFNVVDPPINCPSWVCCLLPCIKHVPSMKAFRQIKPDDAEVKRNGKWIRYDATSLVKGDILRIEEGDIVPADCVVLSLESPSDLLVDHRSVTGEDKPRSSSAVNERGSAQPTRLFWGAHVVQGSAIAVATAIGPNTLVASLIRGKRFPPRDRILEAEANGCFAIAESGGDDEEDQAGISLIARDSTPVS